MLLVPIEVRQSRIHGLGVFAAAPIAEGTRVWQFDPGVDQRHPVDWLQRQPAHVRRFVATHAVLSLDRRHYCILGDQTLFVNHSLDSNLAPRDEQVVNGEGVVVAARAIAPGEELTINYGEIDAADRERLTRGAPLFELQQAGLKS
jgi:uncharacterized protein